MAVYCFSSIALPWLFFVPRASFIIAFVFVWLKTATFIYLLWTMKPELLTCSIRLWCNKYLKRAKTCCVADRDSYKITEQILATCLASSISPGLSLSFGWGYPFLLKWNEFIFNGIDFWVDAFSNLCFITVVINMLRVQVWLFKANK